MNIDFFADFVVEHSKEIDNFLPITEQGKEACKLIKKLTHPSKKHFIEFRNDGQLIQHLRSLARQEKIKGDVFEGVTEVIKLATVGYKNEKGEYVEWNTNIPEDMYVSFIVERSTVDLSRTIDVFHEWFINEEGDIEHTRPPYLVDANRLNESDWLEHVAEKMWVDLNDFVPLYLRSLSQHGYKLKVVKK